MGGWVGGSSFNSMQSLSKTKGNSYTIIDSESLFTALFRIFYKLTELYFLLPATFASLSFCLRKLLNYKGLVAGIS